jgi:hypothetical protein
VSTTLFRLGLAGLLALGCAHEPSAVRVVYAQLGTPSGGGALSKWSVERPLIVEFEKGDRLPVQLEVTSGQFAFEPSPAKLELVVQQHCFVRFDGSGVKVSRDGIDFDAPSEPGSFRLGLNVVPGRRPFVEVNLTAPRH